MPPHSQVEYREVESYQQKTKTQRKHLPHLPRCSSANHIFLSHTHSLSQGPTEEIISELSDRSVFFFIVLWKLTKIDVVPRCLQAGSTEHSLSLIMSVISVKIIYYVLK